jgi:phosphohistidine phosphatase
LPASNRQRGGNPITIGLVWPGSGCNASVTTISACAAPTLNRLRYPRAVQVFLIRHAEAAPETLALADPHRYLTPDGRRQARAIGDRLRWHDCLPTHIWSSPLVRAVQTAELVARHLDTEIAVDVVPALAPDENPRAVVAALAALPAGSITVVVGHEPGLSALGALLTRQPELAGLAKAEAVRIADGAVRWRFAWNADAPEITAG